MGVAGPYMPSFSPMLRLMWLQYGNQPGYGFIADDGPARGAWSVPGLLQ